MTDGRAAATRLFSPAVLTTFGLLVVPVALGALDTTLMTPLALPGYLLLTLGSVVGSRIFSQYALWLFWVPFVAGSYLAALVAVETGRAVARRT